MNKGSAADVMQYGWPGGMEEEVICCILRQALQGLKYASPVVSMGRVRLLNTSVGSYLHINGFIHRDVKAANLLIDDDGTVLLGDLGVAADLSEESSRYTASSEKSASDSAALNQTQTPRMVTFQPRLVLNKRKSFVGTVCICLVLGEQRP